MNSSIKYKNKRTHGRIYFRAAFILFSMLVFLLYGIILNKSAYAADVAKNVEKLEKKVQNEITVTSDIGPSQGFFPFHVTEVNLTVNNGKTENFNGEIIVKTNLFQYRVANVAVSAQSSKKYSLFVRLDKYSYNLKVALLNSGDVVIYDETVKLVPLSEEDYSIMAICENTSFFSHFKIENIERKTYLKRDQYSSSYNKNSSSDDKNANVVLYQYKPEEIPRNSSCLAPYSIIVLNASDLSSLSKAQSQAVIDYAYNGGILFVSYGGFASRLSASPVSEILPVTVNGSCVIDHGDFYKTAYENFSQDEQAAFAGQNIALTLGGMKPGAKSIMDFNYSGSNYPLLAFKNYGGGMVYFAAFDISGVDISRIKYMKDNITAMLKKSDMNSAFSIKQTADGLLGFSSGFNQSLITPPKPHNVIIILCIFCFLVGPVFYYVNRSNTNMIKIMFYPLALSGILFGFFSASGFGILLEKTQIYEFSVQFIDNAENKIQQLTAVMFLQTPLSTALYNIDASATSNYHQKNSYSDNSEILYDDETAVMLSPKMGYSLMRSAFLKNRPLNGKFTFDVLENSPDKIIPAKNGQMSEISNGSSGPGTTEVTDYKKELSDGNTDLLIKKFNEAINRKKSDFKNSGVKAALEQKKWSSEKIESFKLPDGRDIASATNNTELKIYSSYVIYKNGIYLVGSLMPGEKINFDMSEMNSKKAFINSREYIQNCIETIMNKNVSNFNSNKMGYGYSYNYNYFGNYYYNDNLKSIFFDSICSRIFEMSQHFPVVVGFVPAAGSVSPALKIKDCDVINNGSLVFYALN
ncbi:MAG: hypothetical protein QMC67_07940 [Candidatus Wallbacteria bacterium]